MNCPKCGKTRKESDIDCPYCGIVYHKYEAIQKRDAEAPATTPPFVSKKQEPSPWAISTPVKLLVAGVVCMFVAAYIFAPEKAAPPASPPKAAVSKPQPTAAQKAAQAAKRERERAERERQRADEYERCKIDLQCWGEKHLISAASASQGMIERLAKYDFEWIDGFWKTKLSRWRWLDENKHTLIYFGDQIKLQNGFGAWQRCIYRVDYDPINEKVINVIVNPGRLEKTS